MSFYTNQSGLHLDNSFISKYIKYHHIKLKAIILFCNEKMPIYRVEENGETELKFS